jgi:hypothetical protein
MSAPVWIAFGVGTSFGCVAAFLVLGLAVMAREYPEEDRRRKRRKRQAVHPLEWPPRDPTKKGLDLDRDLEARRRILNGEL